MFRIFFFLVLFLHGLIHLMGFAKAFKYAEITQLTQPISRTAGVFWLLAAVLFLVATAMFFLQKDDWWMFALPAVVISQWLIFTSWQDAKFGTIANVLILIATIVGYGTWSYYKQFKNEVNSGLAVAASIPESILTEADMQYLPEPVRKYLRYSGAVGKPKVNNFKVEFVGQIRKNEQK